MDPREPEGDLKWKYFTLNTFQVTFISCILWYNSKHCYISRFTRVYIFGLHTFFSLRLLHTHTYVWLFCYKTENSIFHIVNIVVVWDVQPPLLPLLEMAKRVAILPMGINLFGPCCRFFGEKCFLFPPQGAAIQEQLMSLDRTPKYLKSGSKIIRQLHHFLCQKNWIQSKNW